MPAIFDEPVGTARRHDPSEHALWVLELEQPEQSAAAIEIDFCFSCPHYQVSATIRNNAL